MARRGGFPGGMGGGMNMQAMIKKAQKLQQEMAKAQQELAEKEYTGTAGGGVVSVTVKGSNQLVDIKLDPAVIDPDDIETLQDLIIAAVNQALTTADAESAAIMSKATGGGMPGMF